MKETPPEFCDFDCSQADFPPADTAGLCRTMSAVWCQELGELVNKNAPCEWRRRQAQKLANGRKRTRKNTRKRAKPAR